jgi:hypothetical protein
VSASTSPTASLHKVIAQLGTVAERFLALSVHAQSRRVVESYWNTKSEEELFFLFERGLQLRPVPSSTYREVMRALGEIHHGTVSKGAPLPGVMVEFVRGTGGMPLDQAWDDLRESLDVSLSGFAGSVTVSVPEPVVTIQDSPAEARRKTLLALDWPTSAEAAQRFGATAKNTAQWAKDRRDAGQLLGVWDSGKRTYRHPDFQFDETGALRPEVQALLTALAANPAWTAQADANGWRRAYWLYQPFRSLSERAMHFARMHPPGAATALHDTPDGAAAMLEQWQDARADYSLARTPAEVFAEDPDAVVRFAWQHAGDPSATATAPEGRA